MGSTELVVTRLEELEQVIERGLQTFVDVGNALLEIRDSRLYRETHGTFEDYCRERWSMSRIHAHRQIEAAKVAQMLPTGNIPTTESQARPLTGLPVSVQGEAWQRAVDTAPNGKVTAKHVDQVAREYKQTTTTRYADFDDGWGPDEDDAPAIEYEEPIAEPEPPVPNSMAVHYSSETSEHYTPKEVWSRILTMWGQIDLDPCSNDKLNPSVPADVHYTESDDGLRLPWFGKVYMNPPYGNEIGQWVTKLCEEYRAGRIEEAIALVPARTDTKWFGELDQFYPLICYVTGRLRFVGSSNNTAPFPSAVFYFGPNGETFIEAFDSLGRIQQTLHPEMYGA